MLTWVKDDARIRIDALTPAIIRIRVAVGETPGDDASWAVSAQQRKARAAASITATGLTTTQLAVTIDEATGRITVRDPGGALIHADAAVPWTIEDGRLTLRKSLAAAERFGGLGDKTGPRDRRGASYVHWNTDAYGYGPATDPIYKSVPFVVARGGAAGSYGLFLDEPGSSWFDFGHREDDVLAIRTASRTADYYLIAGPGVGDVVRRYTALTGRAPLPPRWSLGFHQSRYSYMTATEVRGIAERLRRDQVPADAVWLDIDFQDRNRPFTTNPDSFPDLRGLARDLDRNGMRLVAITDLHIAHAPGEGYAPYDSGAAGDHFVRRADGRPYVGPVWPGPSVFPDFTRAATRAWWGGLYRQFVDDGIAGFWNDMNEPAVFETPTKTMPPDVMHRIDTDDFQRRTVPHAAVHNVYGMENSRATFEGLLRLRPDTRPFVLTRASYAGGQKFAATWTGDNNGTWEHLRLMVEQLVNLGLSGFAHAGADIGGFTGGAGPELVTRWYQVGAFTPLMRSHAGKGATRVEPWADGPEHLALRRRAIVERYRLMPYLYAVAEEHARLGDSVMRPVEYDHPAVSEMPCDQGMAFTLGRDLMVAPSPNPASPHPYDVCLPGGGWFDYWTGKRIAEPVVRETPKLERLPVFVRPGAIIARQPDTASTMTAPVGPLSIAVYPGPDCRGAIYWDDGTTLAYQRGDHVRQTIRCESDGDGITIRFDARTGTHRPWWRTIALTVHDWRGPARARLTAGRSMRDVPAVRDADDATLRFTLPDMARGGIVSIRRPMETERP